MHTSAPRLPLQARGAGALPGAAVGAASVLAASAAAVAATVAGLWSTPVLDQIPVDLAVSLGFSVMGALVLFGRTGRTGSRRLGRLMLLMGSAAGLTTVSAVVVALAAEPTTVARVAAQVTTTVWVLGFLPLLTLLPLRYPDGELLGSRSRIVEVASWTGIALLLLGVGLYPETLHGRVEVPKLLVAESAAQLLGMLAAALLVPSVVAALVGLVVRLRRSTGLERRQIAVLLGAAALLVLDVAAQRLLPAPYRPVVQAVAVLLVPVAIGVSITRHRLFDLDLAVRRFLLGLSVVVSVVALFATVLAVSQTLVPQGPATALAAGVSGLLLQPLAARLSAGADRLLYGDRADPYAVMRTVAEQAREGRAPDEVLQVLADTIRGSLRFRRVSVGVVSASGRTSVATSREPGTTDDADDADAEHVVELRHRGQRVGLLAVLPRAGERTVSDRDRSLLQSIGDQVAPVVASLRAYAQLRESREALVAAREEERLRLRHDLHDGVGAALAGVRLQLESARVLVDHPVAGRLLDAAGAGVAAAVDDVRQVTEDLRPPALDELGLVGSLRSLGERLSTSPRPVRTTLPDQVPDLAAATEVACYRIATEALTNAVRHSGGSHVTLTLRVEDDRLVLEVGDDGRGDVRPRAGGVGLESMRRRADEVGGRLVLTSGSGTLVRAELPVDLQ
jgi:two-component system, NarL family, sensor kinase